MKGSEYREKHCISNGQSEWGINVNLSKDVDSDRDESSLFHGQKMMRDERGEERAWSPSKLFLSRVFNIC